MSGTKTMEARMKVRKTNRKIECAEKHEGSHVMAYERSMDVYQCEGCGKLCDGVGARRIMGKPASHDEDGM